MIQVCIEGNVGVGKSSVVKELQTLFSKAVVVPEPAAEWEERGLLRQMYRDPKAHANSFQQSALAAIVVAHASVTAAVMITERSVYSNKYVFSRVHMRPEERLNYDYTYEKLTGLLRARQPFFFLLTAPTDVLLERIRRRGRPSEQDIDSAYLERVQRAHVDWLAEETDVVEVDATLPTKKIAELIRLEVASKIK